VRRPNRRTTWIVVFLTGTALVVAAELVASWDGNPDTVPWTELIVGALPGEVFVFLGGGFVCWLVVHFAIRYRRKSKRRTERRGDDGR
jgi:hypothetical protein